MPHYATGQTKYKKNTPVLFDWGAKKNEYCSDISRMLITNKKNDKFNKAYEVVYTAQKKAIEAICDGMVAKDIDKIARDHINKNGFEGNFLHSLGHGVGLAIHEEPRLSSLSETILKENMVITVEPGIYISGWGGIRIEDIVLVKKNNAEILGSLKK